MFEGKVVWNLSFAYTCKEGEKWAKTTRGHWLPRSPGTRTILEWAEEQQGNEITESVMDLVVKA